VSSYIRILSSKVSASEGLDCFNKGLPPDTRLLHRCL